jgi:hypothetical protein
MMSDAAAVSLTVGQVVDLINQAKAGGANPVVVGMQIFNNLGDDMNVTGSTLNLALSNSGITIDPVFTPLVGAIQTISKTGNHVSVTLNQPVQVQQKIKVDFDQNMSFDVSNEGGAPSLNNVEGLSGHKGIFGAAVKTIQLTQNQGQWSVAVKTSLKTFTFDLA